MAIMMKLFLVMLLLPLSVACGDGQRPEPSPTAASPVPVVRENSGHLIFSWFDGGTAATATRPGDVPEAHRKEVRVQDPTIPPEKRNPSIVYLADLTRTDAKGNFRVRAIAREEWERRRHPQQTADAAPVAENGDVIMYVTPFCPHCKKARKWLLEQQIPYREVDLEKDPEAAAALARKGQSQGVSTSGVPIFEINGRLVPGFSPEDIRRALSAPPAPPPPPAAPPQAPPATRAVI